MRILQLIQKPQYRGAEVFASQLSNHLATLGHEVKLVSLQDGDAVLPFTDSISLNRSLKGRLFDYKGWRLLADLIQQFQPDIIQANAGDTLKMAVLSKLILRWKTPIVFRNANKVSDFLDSRLKKWLNLFLTTQLSHVISVSELCRLDYIKTYGFDANRISKIPIGIDHPPNEGPDSNDEIISFNHRNLLVHTASFVPEKNHRGLVRIVQKLVDGDADVHLMLLGDGKLRKEVQQKVDDIGLSDRILFLGYRKDAKRVMAQGKALVLPSLIEGLPGVILEAMQAKVPVIAYNVGGISEVIKHKETGWLVEKEDEEGFVNAVKEVLTASDSEIKRVTENAYKLVREEYDNFKIAKRFLEVYEHVLMNSKFKI